MPLVASSLHFRTKEFAARLLNRLDCCWITPRGLNDQKSLKNFQEIQKGRFCLYMISAT